MRGFASEDVRLAVRLDRRHGRATCYVPGQEPLRLEMAAEGTTHSFFLRQVPLYMIIRLQDE